MKRHKTAILREGGSIASVPPTVEPINPDEFGELPVPTKRGLHMTPAYAASLGVEKTCTCCGETKVISPKTFAQRKDMHDGTSPVCRSCQGRGASIKGAGVAIAIGETNPMVAVNDDGVVVNAVTEDEELVARNKSAEARKVAVYWKNIKKLTDEVYEISEDRRHAVRCDEIVRQLSFATRLTTDPVRGQHPKSDSKLAFLTFCYVVSRCIAGWREFGSIHDDIIGALLSDEDRIMVLASRNSGKSGITEMFSTWLLHRYPMIKILVVSGGANRASQCLRSVRMFLAQCPMLTYLEPVEDCQDNSRAFVCGPAYGHLGAFVSFASFGISSNMVGQRGDVILLDDIETRADVTSDRQETLDHRCAETFNLLNPCTTNAPWAGRVVALGTPQIPGISIYGRHYKLQNEDGEYIWTTTIARLFDEEEKEGLKQPVLHTRWADRWSDSELTKKRATLSKREWDLHWKINLSTLDTDDRPLKLREFICHDHPASSQDFPSVIRHGYNKLSLEIGSGPDADDYLSAPEFVSPDLTKYVTTVAAVDPSSGISGRDPIGLSVVSVTAQGMAVIRCLAGITAASTVEAMAKLAATIHKYLPNTIYVEGQANSLFPSALGSLMAKRGYPVSIETVCSQQKKGVRICDAISSALGTNRVVILQDVVHSEDFLEAAKQITGIKLDSRGLTHDDIIDSLSWALAGIANMLQVDESSSLNTVAMFKLADLRRLNIRQGGVGYGGIEEILYQDDEASEQMAMRVKELEMIQNRELKFGIHDELFAKRVDAAKAELARANRFMNVNNHFGNLQAKAADADADAKAEERKQAFFARVRK